MTVKFKATKEQLRQMCRLVVDDPSVNIYIYEPGEHEMGGHIAVFFSAYKGSPVNLLIMHGDTEGEYSFTHGPHQYHCRPWWRSYKDAMALINAAGVMPLC